MYGGNLMAFFSNIWVRVSLTFLVSIAAMAGIYRLSWQMTSFHGSPRLFIEQGASVASSMAEIHSKISGESTGAIECKLIILLESYTLQKGFAENAHRMETFFANLAHTNALFLMIMFVTFVGIVFAIFQMANAYEGDKTDHKQIEIEGASIKLKTGYVSLAVSVIGIAALSLYLPNAHEVKQLENLTPTEIEFDAGKYFEHCGEHIEK